MTLRLHGYRYSVYSWIVRLALAEKRLAADWVEVDPFGPLPPDYARLHPFGRVPVLEHDGFAIYETQAILRYLDAAFPDPRLGAVGARAVAREAQVAGIVDSYGYWPLVRQVFAHAAFRPAAGEAGDAAVIARGLAAAPRVLAALEEIAAEGLVLSGSVGLADIHLAPMLGYFTAAPEGAAMLAGYPALAARFAEIAARPAFAATDPGLPQANSP